MSKRSRRKPRPEGDSGPLVDLDRGVRSKHDGTVLLVTNITLAERTIIWHSKIVHTKHVSAR